MGKRMIKEGTVGNRRAYISRPKALKKLQLNLRDFRRLTILKGIHPVEPKSKKKVNPSSNLRTFYLLKDIQLLAHDPLVNKCRDLKVMFRKVARAKGRKEFEEVERIRQQVPSYNMNHIIKERYPTFDLALRELGDAISLLSFYSTYPSGRHLPLKFIVRSQRLVTEFLLCVIEMRTLRKAFVTSNSGIWYEAEIRSTPIVWNMPIVRGVRYEEDVDINVLTTHTEIWSSLVEHVNGYLYNKMNLQYPPKLSSKDPMPLDDYVLTQGEDLEVEQVGSLAHPLKGCMGFSKEDQEELDPDLFENDEEYQRRKAELEHMRKFPVLFEDCKFFISRGGELLHLVFIIRSCGGQVSWERTMGPGATFPENDPGITHQIHERPSIQERYANRAYVQSLWLFDSLNNGALMPTHPYRVGVMPPPHLSPFVDEKPGEYVPPEKEENLRLRRGERRTTDQELAEEVDEEDESEEESSGDEEEEPPKKSEEEEKKKRPKKLTAKQKQEAQEAENKRLAIMMMPKKHKKLYNKIMYAKKKTNKMANHLRNKRAAIEEEKRKKAEV